MPLYEYQCQACGHRFEVIQKFSDAPPAECPKCGGAVEKLVSSPAIQFKGSGFYLTDYGRGGKSDTAPARAARSESGEQGRQGGQGGQGDKAEKADKAREGREGRRRATRRTASSASASSGDHRRGDDRRQQAGGAGHAQVRLVGRSCQRRQPREAALKSRPTVGVRPCSARYLRNGAARSGRRNAK